MATDLVELTNRPWALDLRRTLWRPSPAVRVCNFFAVDVAQYVLVRALRLT